MHHILSASELDEKICNNYFIIIVVVRVNLEQHNKQR